MLLIVVLKVWGCRRCCPLLANAGTFEGETTKLARRITLRSHWDSSHANGLCFEILEWRINQTTAYGVRHQRRQSGAD